MMNQPWVDVLCLLGRFLKIIISVNALSFGYLSLILFHFVQPLHANVCAPMWAFENK